MEKTYKEIIKNRPQATNSEESSHGLFMRHGIVNLTYDNRRVGHRDTRANQHRLRLTSWSRLSNFTPGIMIRVKHGLSSTYRGLGSFFSNLFRCFGRKVIKKIPSLMSPTIDTGKITKQEALDVGKMYLKKTRTNILNEIRDAAVSKINSSHGVLDKAGLYSIYRTNPNIHIKKFIREFNNNYGGLREMTPLLSA